MEFTFSSYRHLLDIVLSQGYTTSSYHDYTATEKPCIIRHDIDLSPIKAIRIGEIEYEACVKSTYFVLLNTSFYNVASNEVQSVMKQLQSLGHEIGLHFDEKQYSDCDSEDSIKKHICDEAEILGEILGMPITTVSMHRPSKRTLESNYEFDGLINSYGKMFFNDFKYLSDSRMRWKEDVEEAVASGHYNALHILTHPIWYNCYNSNIHDVLLEFLRNASDERYNMLRNNISNLENDIKRSEI